jgi:hypothetical protein
MTSIKPVQIKAAALFTVLLLLVSCHRYEKKYLVPEKEFLPFMVDLHIAESIAAESKKGIDLVYEVDSAGIYGSVFKKHGITKAMFDSTMIYYSKNPVKFQKLYNAINVELKRMESILTEEQQQLEVISSQILWKSDSIYRISNNMSGSKIEIDVPISGPGIYAVSANVKILPTDNSLDPRMSIYFYRDDSIKNGKRLRFQEIRYTSRKGEDKVYRAVKRLSNPDFTHIRGSIINFSNGDTLFLRNMVVKDILVSKRPLNDSLDLKKGKLKKEQ